ncbi:DUF6090 family protein [Portibacter marinus]|uniref:DUF6090 family protein n=1 Tax=Portibacter marinus TaxID=2898660 RepID=UPI001F314537|nr:DUF6090 family protein [Portibacter marinus]
MSLIDRGRFKKYLLYAIGEVILVVFGILIALQINNWNKQKLDRIAEKRYLISFVEDLRKNEK